MKKTTDAQKRLIAWLISESERDPQRLDQRWGPGSTCARGHASEGRLLLCRDWTQDTVLTPDGQIEIVDVEDGNPPRLATESEARTGLFRSIVRYPELLSLLPARPSHAVTCSGCGGTGIWSGALERTEFRAIVCKCGGAGWTVDVDKESPEHV